MELVDCHTHTCHSDGTATTAENVARAARLGITTLCITDHLTLPHAIDPNCEVSVPEADLAAYASDIAVARELHPEVEVVFGFECDYYPSCEDNVARWSAGATFRLGSVHMLDGSWIDDLSDLAYWDAHTTEEVWRRYFEVWAEACASPCRFDSMAHPDLVSLLGRIPGEGLRRALYAAAAEAAHDTGVHVEINTAGLIKPVGRIYPDDDLLAAFARAEVPLTIGSDAHRVDRIGEAIVDAYGKACRAGYRSVDVPTSDGGWRTLRLDDEG